MAIVAIPDITSMVRVKTRFKKLWRWVGGGGALGL